MSPFVWCESVFFCLHNEKVSEVFSFDDEIKVRYLIALILLFNQKAIIDEENLRREEKIVYDKMLVKGSNSLNFKLLIYEPIPCTDNFLLPCTDAKSEVNLDHLEAFIKHKYLPHYESFSFQHYIDEYVLEKRNINFEEVYWNGKDRPSTGEVLAQNRKWLNRGA